MRNLWWVNFGRNHLIITLQKPQMLSIPLFLNFLNFYFQLILNLRWWPSQPVWWLQTTSPRLSRWGRYFRGRFFRGGRQIFISFGPICRRFHLDRKRSFFRRRLKLRLKTWTFLSGRFRFARWSFFKWGFAPWLFWYLNLQIWFRSRITRIVDMVPDHQLQIDDITMPDIDEPVLVNLAILVKSFLLPLNGLSLNAGQWHPFDVLLRWFLVCIIKPIDIELLHFDSQFVSI